jgi:hypothetical protein
MKKLFTLVMISLMTVSVMAQNNSKKLYLLFEFMQVKNEKGSDYYKVEDFWSGIHKQRVANKQILGWDLWSLTPSGKNQGAQYMTVTLFSSLKDMLNPGGFEDLIATAKKAYPKMTEKEITDMLDQTGNSRDIADQVYFEQVDVTTGDYQMKVGTMATIDVMKQLEDNYEKSESEIFKPYHQKLVNAGKVGEWSLLRAILPAGSDSYGTHITVSMFKDAAQLATYMEAPMGDDIDFLTQSAAATGFKTREWKEKKVATLQMMVR